MENLLVTSLVVSAIGMALLFLALALLYGLMYLMTTVLRDPAPAQAPTAIEAKVEPTTRERVLQAAAVAVALARAGQDLSPAGAAPVSEASDPKAGSRWWTLHHARQMTGRPITRRPQ